MHHNSPWFIFDKKPGPDDMILFCLHFAGGTAALFREWQPYAPPGVVVCRVQLPGHGTRMGEALLTDMPSVVEALAYALCPWLGHRYSFFGHSMGGTIAAEWTIRLQTEGLPLPARLFISASEPTHRRWRPTYRDYSSKQFRELLFNNGGAPREVLENEELMEIFEPIIRADYTVLETWSPQPIRSIHAPITVFAGQEDHVVPKEVVAHWKLFAAASWQMKMMPGGHFFIQTHADLIRDTVFGELQPLMKEAHYVLHDA